MKTSRIKSSGYKNVEGYMRGLPKATSMSETAPILVQLKQWYDNKWVNMEHFKTVPDHMQTRIQNQDMLILQSHPPSSTAGQQSGGSAAAVDDPAQKCTAVPSSTNVQGLLTLPGYAWGRKRHLGHSGGVDGIYLVFCYICLSDFLFSHIVTTSPVPPPP
jgi:hypothetical protein